jgi:hypothetical protein
MTKRIFATASNRNRCVRRLVTASTAWHDRALPRTVLFLAHDSPAPHDGLHILVHDSVSAEASALERLAHDPRGGSRLVIDAAGDGPEAESALLDAWLELGPEAGRVWCAVGALAGVLLRVARGAVTPTACFGPACDLLPGPNARSRALLASIRADSWTVALSDEPPLDAEAWRKRLRAAIDLGWELQWDPAAGTRASARGWLDQEISSRQRRHGRGGLPAGALLPGIAAADDASKVVQGRGGRLFLARDSHESHQQILGKRPLTAGELDTWVRGTRQRQSRMAGRGARLIQLLCPAAQAVHASALPAGAAVSPERPAMQLVSALRSLSPAPRFLYPIDELQRVAAFRDPFSTTDSHWNDLGAYVAYEHVLDRLDASVPVRRLPRSAVSFHDTCFIGDLGEKVTPARASRFLRARVVDARARLVADNRVRNHGRQGEFTCDAAPPTRCVVFGDSCAYPMLLFLAESFGRLVFRHRVNVVDDDLVDAERPDVVLVVLTERFCTALPEDERARPFDAEVARKQRSKDGVLPPPGPGEQPSLTFSIDPDRQFVGGPAVYLPPGGV